MKSVSPFQKLLGVFCLLTVFALGAFCHGSEKPRLGNFFSPQEYALGDVPASSILHLEIFVFEFKTASGFTYNTKGEVVNTDHNNNAFDKSQSFDGIGNRTTATDATGVTNYTSNNLNQYSAVGTVTRTHDDDGNTLGGVKTANNTQLDDIKWNGNNRLTKVTTADGKLIEVEYDHMGRRFRKSVVDVANGVNKRIAWIYGGYCAIAKYEASSNANLTLAKTYYWGIDLGGGEGTGGMLSEVTHGTSVESLFTQMDGNGNITEYLDTNGIIKAHFEFDSFGQKLVASGTEAQTVDYGFSTRAVDRDLGLVYYNYRYLNVVDGRWLSRDPIEERGGVNVYGFVGNDGVGRFDRLGLSYEEAFKISGKNCKTIVSKLKHQLTPEYVSLLEELCCCSRAFRMLLGYYSRTKNPKLIFLEGKEYDKGRNVNSIGSLTKEGYPRVKTYGNINAFWTDSLSTLAHEIIHVAQIDVTRAKGKREGMSEAMTDRLAEFIKWLKNKRDGGLSPEDPEARRGQRVIHNEIVRNCPKLHLKYGRFNTPIEYEKKKIVGMKPLYTLLRGKIGYYKMKNGSIVWDNGKPVFVLVKPLYEY